MHTVAFYHNDQGQLLQNCYEKITGGKSSLRQLIIGRLAQAVK